MDPVTGVVASQAVQGVSDVVSDVVDAIAGDGQSDFEGFMRNILVSKTGSEVNEEELFAAVLQQRIAALKGDDAAQQFSEHFEKHKNATRRADGYEFVEDSAKAALADLEADGTLTSEEASEIEAQSFRAAQLDDNLNALYDGRGGSGDTTVAKADLDSALSSAESLIEKLISGELGLDDGSDSLSTSSSDAVTTENPVDGDEGFLFKPASDSDGKLVVLLPAEIAGDIESVILRDSEDKVIEEGKFSANSNGGRDTYRFSKAGEDYEENITVEVRLVDGSTKLYEIPNPAERYD